MKIKFLTLAIIIMASFDCAFSSERGDQVCKFTNKGDYIGVAYVDYLKVNKDESRENTVQSYFFSDGWTDFEGFEEFGDIGGYSNLVHISRLNDFITQQWIPSCRGINDQNTYEGLKIYIENTPEIFKYIQYLSKESRVFLNELTDGHWQ